MVTFSTSAVYVISFTDVVKGTISIPKDSIVTDRLDVTLIGKSSLDYGEVFDENILHLLENFAANQDLNIGVMVVRPDLSQVTNPLFQQPSEGQFWYNKTNDRLYVLDSTGVWNPLKMRGDIAGTSGIISHGQQIPLPAGISTYAECSWFVSPQYVDQQENYIACYTDATANVTSLYRSTNSTILVDGLANYIIIGNKATNNHYVPVVSVTPTLTPAPMSTVTPTPTITSTPTPAPASSVTPTPTVSPTNTITITPTLTVTPTLTRTITQTVSPTPTASPVLYQTLILFTGGYQPVIPIPGPIPGGTIPGPYVFIGFNQFPDSNLIPFGSLTPNTFNGLDITFLVASANNSPAILYLGIINGTPTSFQFIQFVDAFGIFRTFNASDAAFISGATGGGPAHSSLYSWTIPASVFSIGSQYTILIR